jgi:hypothetical protein
MSIEPSSSAVSERAEVILAFARSTLIGFASRIRQLLDSFPIKRLPRPQ